MNFMNTKAISIESVHKSFKVKGESRAILRGVSLHVYEGKVVGFLGANGSGKTTTLSILADLLKPDSGHVSILGKQARFLMPLTKVMTYNLMVLGKALIVANSKLIPRVVKTDLLFNLNDSDYASLTMEYIKLKNQFVLLLSKVDGRLHSNVIVKLLNPEKET